MTLFAPSPPITPTGGYVVAGPVQTGAMGDILRASFGPRSDVSDDFRLLLAKMDEPRLPS